jgi:ankyrin repeat protein
MVQREKLADAVSNNTLQVAQEILQFGIDPNFLSCGSSLLSLGVMSSPECVELLLKNGADPNLRDSSEATPLYYAIITQSATTVKMLINAGANGVNIDGLRDRTAIHCAVEGGSCDIVSIVAEAMPEDIESFDSCGFSPLMSAVREGDIDIVRKLLDLGAMVNGSEQATYDETPLHVAARFPDKEITRLLVNKGANLSARDYLGRRPIDLYTQRYSDCDDLEMLQLMAPIE